LNNFMEYKGFYGSVEFSSSDRILFGQVVGIDSLVSYQGFSLDELESDFQGAVDDYLDLCNEAGVEPEYAFSGGDINIKVAM